MTDYRDNMTIDEMAENDGYMVEHAIKNAKRYTFFNLEEARAFTGRAVQETLDRLGIKIRPGVSPKFIDKHLEHKRVKVECREKYKGNDTWKCGIYIYQDGELVAFVSSVFHDEPNPFLLRDQRDKFYVISNAKVK
jgi:hypothetical protein